MMEKLMTIVFAMILVAHAEDKLKMRTDAVGSRRDDKGQSLDAIKMRDSPIKASKSTDLKGADTIGLGFYGGVVTPTVVVPLPAYPRLYPGLIPRKFPGYYPKNYPGYYPKNFPGYYPRYYPGFYPKYPGIGSYFPFSRRPVYWGGYPYRPRPIPVLIE